MSRSALMIAGVIVFLAGGAVLALVAGPMGTGLGTTAALAGVALLGWGWMRRSSDRDAD